MDDRNIDFLRKNFGITEEIIFYEKSAEEQIQHVFEQYQDIQKYNQYKVLNAMQKCRLSDTHFNWTTGYGYNDVGREKVEEIFSTVFGAEDALVRSNIVNGTHALTLCLQGLLFPGDVMLSISSKPYDTLDRVIGISEDSHSLASYGVRYRQVNFLKDGSFDRLSIEKEMRETPDLKMVYIQRSKGYSNRKSLSVDDIESIVKFVRDINPNVIIMVDNCYGEFLETREPTEVGVDIMAGSLIKNPGGGLALTGGYICGKKHLIDAIAKRLTSPSIGNLWNDKNDFTRIIFSSICCSGSCKRSNFL